MKLGISFWLSCILILTLLFITSSTDLIIKEERPVVYPMSIIIDDETDENFFSFRKGVERAAEDFNVDINFITLFESGNRYDQLERIKEELRGDASALMIAPVEGEEVVSEILKNTIKENIYLPLVLFHNAQTSYEYSSVSINYKKTGKKLAEMVAKEQEQAKEVYLFYTGEEGIYNKELYEGLEEGLEEVGFQVTSFADNGDGENINIQFEDLALHTEKQPVVICMDKSSLVKTSKILDDRISYQCYIAGLYGVGSTTYILSKLSTTIDGVMVWNEYQEGYTVVEKAVEQIRVPGTKSHKEEESFYITAKNLREEKYMKMLYPMD